MIARTMQTPPVQYVTTKDGYNIAYTVSGEGLPFLLLPTWMNHVQGIWDPRFGDEFPQALAEHFRLINYDARGMGMSSRGLGPGLTLESYFLDINAVLDRLGIERFVLLGSHSSTLLAGQYAARHPDRVSALILMNSGIRWLGEDIGSLWEDLPRQSWDSFLYMFVPSTDLHLARLLGLCITQEDYLASVPVWRSSGLQGVLNQIQAPTLVLKPRDCPCSLMDSAIELARLLPNGRLALLDGDLAFGPPGQAVRVINDFLAEIGLTRPATSTGEASPSTIPRPPVGLSVRQMQVLQLIAEGKTNGEIADALVISLRTVERHVAELYAKIGARNRVEAASFAMNQLAKA